MNLVPQTTSAHWYGKDGTPQHTVPYAGKRGEAGERRATNITDARKLNLNPSVTTIQKVEHKFQLEAYKITQAILSAITLPRMEGEGDDEFARRVVVDMQQPGKEAAQTGTTAHDDIDLLCRSIKTKSALPAETAKDPYVKAAEGWLNDFVDEIIETEASFCSDLYGGRIDMLCRMKDGREALVDWKTQGMKKGVAAYYPEWGEQLAAYAIGIKKPNVALVNVVFDTKNPGAMEWKEWEGTVEEKFDVFMAVYKLWANRNNWKQG